MAQFPDWERALFTMLILRDVQGKPYVRDKGEVIWKETSYGRPCLLVRVRSIPAPSGLLPKRGRFKQAQPL